MSIKNFVSTLVSQIQVDNTPFTFAHGEADWQNMLADEQNYPVVYLDEPISNDFLLLNSGAIQEFYPIKMLFLYKTELDFTPDQHDQVIQKARLAARKFISLCANAEEVKEAKNSKGIEIINLFDANTSGLVLTLDLHFYNFESVCANYTPNTSFTTLTNSADNWSVQVPNGSNYVVPDTFFDIVDQFGANLGDFEIPSVIGGTVIVNLTPPECLDGTIEVNGNTFGTVASGGMIDIPVVNGGSNSVGTIDGGQVIIGDSSVFINGTQVGDVVAEDTLSIAVELDGALAGTWNANTQTWEVESIPCPVIDITVNSEPFLSGLTSNTNIGLVDQDGDPLDFTVDGNDLVVDTTVDADWIRPFDWLNLPNVLPTEQKFVGLHSVIENSDNYVAFSFTTSAGQYFVDWGDGNTSFVNSGVIAQHQYNYSTYDVSNTTLSTRGYKQAIIVVTPVSGNLLSCNFQQRFVTSPIQNQAYSTGFLDCILSMPNASSGQSIIFGGASIRHSFVERCAFKTIGNSTAMLSMFQNCSSLQSVPLFNTANVMNMNSMFANCFSLQSVPLFNTVNVTNMTSMFSACYTLQSVPLFNTVNVTSMNGMFASCFSLQSVPLFNTSNVTNMNNMFANCFSLQSVPLFNTVNVTNMNSMFQNCLALNSIPALSTVAITTDYGASFASACNSLNRCQMVLQRNVSFANCQLSQNAIVEIFNNLATVTTVQTITITGNWGASALTPADRAIATSKNWTITG